MSDKAKPGPQFFFAAPVLFVCVENAHALTLRVKGKVLGSKITFSGTSTVSIVSGKGTVTGHLNNGTACTGSTRLNASRMSGIGDLKCADGTSAKYTFTINSSVPMKGSSSGTTNKGQNIGLDFSR